MKPPLSYVPALPAATGMMAGIVLYAGGVEWPWGALLAAAAATAIVMRFHLVGFTGLFAVLGWLFSLAATPLPVPETAMNRPIALVGEICDVSRSQGAVRLTVDTRADGNPIRCSLLIPGAGSRFECGDSISFTARLRQPGSEADLPDENSFNPTVYVDGITAEAYVSPDDVTVTGHRDTLRRVAERWRDRLRDLIYMSPVNSSSAWFLSATLLGDDSMLDPSMRESFRATGTAHYLALSGFHVGIVAMLAGLILFPFRTWSRAGRYRHPVVILLIWGYVVVCGMSASLVRAAVLITIFLLAKVLGRPSSPYNSLCIAAIIILSYAPRQLFAPGFQLSFAAVLAILLIAPRINPFSRRRNTAYRIAELFTVPVAAMTGTCLITMVHFHRLPLLFLLPNLLLGILMPVLLTSGIILMAATACGLNLRLIGNIVDFFCGLTDGICMRLSGYAHAEISGIFLSAPTIVAGALTLALLIVALRRKRPVAFMIAAACGAVTAAAAAFTPSLPESELIVTRRPLRTDIVVRHRDQCMLVSTADSADIADVLPDLSRRYRDYLSRRGCSDTILGAPDHFDLGPVRRRGSWLVFGDKLMYVSSSPAPPAEQDIHIDYLLITRSTGPHPEDIIGSITSDTVLIAADLPPRRRERLRAYCHRTGRSCLDLRSAPFRLTSK